MSEPGDITRILQRIRLGDTQAEAIAFRMLYKELRQMALRQMQRERIGHTLAPTALVHEAYLRLVKQREKTWQSRGHFLAVAAQVMRRVLVDYARTRNASKRGGTMPQEVLTENLIAGPGIDVRILDLDRALSRLAELDSRQARIVEFRFFGGMSDEEAAGVLGISLRTVRRDWAVARAWLYGQLTSGQQAAPDGRNMRS